MPQITIGAQTSSPTWKGTKHLASLRRQVMGALSARAAPHMAAWIKQNRPFTPREGPGGVADPSNWKASVSGDEFSLRCLVPYAYWLNYGVKPHSMTYLQGRVIKLPWGFRTVTAENLHKGAWYHPGTAPTYFVQRAMADLATQVQSRFPGVKIKVGA